MIIRMWRSTDGTTVVWEVNPGMLYSWEATTGYLMPLSEDFRRDCLDSLTGEYELVYG